MSLVEIVLVVIGVYMLFLVFIGTWGYKKTKATPEDYYLGGRALGTLVLSGTLIATYASMWTFLGAVGGNYRLGLSFLSMMMFWNLTWPMMLWLFGPAVWVLGKAYGYITYSELINDYYDSKLLGVIAAVVGILALIPYIGVQLMGGGIALESFTQGGIPYAWGVIFTYIVMVLFISVAGLKSVAWTDTFQGIFFLATMFGLAIYAVSLAGGFGSVFQSLQQSNPSLLMPGKLGFGLWIGFVLTWGMAVILPHMFQRLLMAREPEVLGRSALSLSILSGWVQAVPVFFLGIAATILIPGLTGKATDSVTVLFATKYLPTWLAAVIVAGAFAAGTSTLNSQLLTSSSIVVRDLYVNLTERKMLPSKETWLGRAVVLILGIIVLLFALARPGLIVPISTAGVAIAISGYLYPLIGVVFWPRAGKLAAYGSMITAAVVSIATWLVWKYPFGIYNVLWGEIFGGIVFVILGYVGKPPSPEKIEKFHGLIRKCMCE